LTLVLGLARKHPQLREKIAASLVGDDPAARKNFETLIRVLADAINPEIAAADRPPEY
jgi:hypothetical protein